MAVWNQVHSCWQHCFEWERFNHNRPLESQVSSDTSWAYWHFPLVFAIALVIAHCSFETLPCSSSHWDMKAGYSVTFWWEKGHYPKCSEGSLCWLHAILGLLKLAAQGYMAWPAFKGFLDLNWHEYLEKRQSYELVVSVQWISLPPRSFWPHSYSLMSHCSSLCYLSLHLHSLSWVFVSHLRSLVHYWGLC